MSERSSRLRQLIREGCVAMPGVFNASMGRMVERAALYEKDRIAGAPRTGADRGGLRFSPHFYNLHSEVDRALEAVQRYMKSGV